MRGIVTVSWGGKVTDASLGTVTRSNPVGVAIGQDDEIVQNALDYGLGATIPPSMARSVTVDVPFGLGGSFTEAEISLLPLNSALDEPISLTLDIMDEDRIIASWPVNLKEVSKGPS